MIGAIWQLVPVALGVMASPVAVMALVGILLSERPRRNGIAYLVGWSLCTAALLCVSLLVFRAADAPGAYREAAWVPVVHLLVGLVCVVGAAWTYARTRRVVRRVAAARTPDELAAATPQLPGLVRSVAGFTPIRSFFLGLGIFLTPMNVALVAAAGIAVVLAELSDLQAVLIILGFTAAAAAPVGIPVIAVLIRGEHAAPSLRRLKTWILHRNGYVSAGVLAVVGLLQVVKAVQGWT